MSDDLVSPEAWRGRFRRTQEGAKRILHSRWTVAIDEVVRLSVYESTQVSATLQAMLNELLHVDVLAARSTIEGNIERIVEFTDRVLEPGEEELGGFVASFDQLSAAAEGIALVSRLRQPAEASLYWYQTGDHPTIASGVYWVTSHDWVTWERTSELEAGVRWANDCYFFARMLEQLVELFEGRRDDVAKAYQWDSTFSSGSAHSRPSEQERQHPQPGSRLYWIQCAETSYKSVWHQLNQLRIDFDKRAFPYDESLRARDLAANLLLQIPFRQFSFRSIYTSE